MANEVVIEISTVYKPGAGLARARQEIQRDAQLIAQDVERHFDRASDDAARAFNDVAPKIGRDFDRAAAEAAQAGAKIESSMKETGARSGQGLVGGIKDAFGGLNLSGVGDSIASSLGSLGAAGGPILGAAAGLAAAFGDDFMRGIQQGFSSRRAAVTTAIRTGLSTDVVSSLGSEAGELYARGFGESLAGIRDAAAVVEQNLRGIDDSLDTATVTRYATTFEQAFGIAIPEQTRLARRLIANELAPDTAAAFDLMGVAAQQFGDQMDQGMDVLEEFSPTFRALGIDGVSAVQLVTDAVQGGWFTVLDRAGDMWLELRNRIVASDDAREAVEALKLDFDDLRSKMAQGGEVGEQALQQLITALLSLKDDADLATAAVELFGVNLEEVSDPRHAFEMINQALAMEDGAAAAEKYAGAAEEIATQFEESQSAWDEFSRSMTTRGAEIGGVLAEVVNEAYKLDQALREYDPHTLMFREFKGAIDDVGDAFSDAGGGSREFEGAVVTAADRASDRLLAMKDPALQAADAIGDTADAARQLDDALSAFAGRFDADQALRSLHESLEAVADAASEAEGDVFSLGSGFDVTSEAGRAAARVFEDLSGELDRAAELYQSGAVSADEFGRRHDSVVAGLRAAADQMNLTEGETQQLIDMYGRVPTEVTTDVNAVGNSWDRAEEARMKLLDIPTEVTPEVNAVDGFSGVIASGHAALDGIDGRRATTYIDTIRTTTYATNYNRGRQKIATGGHVSGGMDLLPAAAGGGAGVPTLVNERGPESVRLPEGDVVPLPVGSTVFTAEDTASRFATGGGGGGTVVNFYFAGGVITDRDIEAKMRDLVYRGGLDGLGGVN